MNKHKIFRELFKLSIDELYDLKDIMDLVHEARNDFANVGVEFTYEGFTEYTKRRYAPMIANINNLSYNESYKRRLSIVEGDNLDKIEDAAQDKGLI